MEHYDAIVIGSGQAGTPLSIALSGAGRKTALVESQHVGGTCINVGCTPTKTMVASARIAYLARRAADYGIRCGPVGVDMAQVLGSRLSRLPMSNCRAGSRWTRRRCSDAGRSDPSSWLGNPSRRRGQWSFRHPERHQHLHQQDGEDGGAREWATPGPQPSERPRLT